MEENRVKLTVMGISYTPMQSGAFAMLLAQEDGPYRIPVVIGGAEAQAIAIKMEGVSTPRPMTHDLFCTFARAYDIQMEEVYIYKFEDGIFSSEIRFNDGQKVVTIDSRTSDAVALAVRTGAPIYTTREILEQAGTIFQEKEESTDDEPGQSASRKTKRSLEELPLAELKKLLAKHIEDENYEEAAKIKGIITRRDLEAGTQQA